MESFLCSEFEMNLNQDQTTVPFTTDELEGLSENFFRILNTQTRADGSKEYLVQLKAPHVEPILQQAAREVWATLNL